MGNNIKLSEICTDISYGYTASATSKEIGPKFLRITDIQGGTVSWDHVPFCEISKNDAHKYLLEKGDIVIARTGNSTGENYIFDSDVKAVFASYLIRFRVDSTKANPSFVWLQMRTPEWWSFVESVKSGSAQAGANAKVLGLFELELPEREIQDSIVEIAFNLLNKQNTNLLINQTLEQMSQTLFKSWFVDFDPVIDNALDAGNSIPEALQSRAELRQKIRNSADFKTLPANIRALFPAEFVESESGWIPKGWESESFDSFCDFIQSGGTPSRKETSFWNDGTIKWLSSGEVKGKIVLDTKEKITQTGLLHSSAKLWKRYTTVVAMYGATAGEVCIIGDKMTANQACCGLYSEKYPFYVYNFVSNKTDELASKATGSAQQNLNKLIISSTKFIRPSNAIITIFEDNVAPLFMKWFSNSSENNTLTNLRDTLLPKLISGELSLEDLPDLVDQTEPA
ncbi:restriction endonuclease subunit S [Enterobacter sp. ECC-019]|uniref:restriction endonuclease subunit S n=1 Tax=Enterobacter sp. ECC-019 TaxID=3116478 RepID=UPI00375428C7